MNPKNKMNAAQGGRDKAIINKYLSWFYYDLRLKNPLNYKAPLLISFPYFIIFVSDISWQTAGWNLVLSIVTITGIAGFAYSLNDVTDISRDLRAGRSNALAGRSLFLKASLLLVMLVLAIAPWFYLPLKRLNGTLIIAEFVLFILYSVPPFRFKERGFAGPLTDALYAHVIPALAATLTFSYLAGKTYDYLPHFLVLVAFWQLNFGLRNIILHQLSDLKSDRLSKTRTFVNQVGPEQSRFLLARIIVPLEIGFFFLFAVLVSRSVPWFLVLYCVHLLLAILKIKYIWNHKLPASLEELLFKYLDDFYVD